MGEKISHTSCAHGKKVTALQDNEVIIAECQPTTGAKKFVNQLNIFF